MKRYLVQTFGCQMNIHDSRRIEETLERAGWGPTDDVEAADLVLFNTCSVREKADQKLLSVLGTCRQLKETRPHVLVAVAGCMAQQAGESLLKRAPQLDLVIGPDNIAELPELIASLEGGAPPTSRTVFDLDAPEFLRAEARREVQAFVTIMKGCDERCTFCIVPYTRGPERYRASHEIIDEIARLVAGGVREVTLLGQTVNSWYEPGQPEGSVSEFPALLRAIAATVTGLERLRYTSPHPRHLTPELIAAHQDLDILPRHVHMPVQSGSNRVLKRMLRRYTAEEYLARVDALKDAVPGMTLSTDIIVGFPGETDDDFQATLELVKRAGFVAAFGFKYSQRPHTPALKLTDDVSEEVKDARLDALFAQVEQQQSANLARLVGSTVRVLIEGRSRTEKLTGEAATAHAEPVVRAMGRTERHEIAHVAVPGEPEDFVGAIVHAHVIRANRHSLVAELTSVVRHAPSERYVAPRKEPRIHISRQENPARAPMRLPVL